MVANCAALVQFALRACALVSGGCSSSGKKAFLAHGGDVAARGNPDLDPTPRVGSRFLGTRNPPPNSPCDCDGCVASSG
jgi:hypothetical protein